MGAVAGQCPPAEELDRLLSEQVDETQRAVLETHIECCSTCQDRLERRVTTPEILSGARAAEESCPEPNGEFLDRLKHLPRVGASSGSATDWLESGRLGQYEILGKLGQGGMGMVYRARHAELGKMVALKVLPAAEMHEVSVARFKREMQAIGRLEHPNIVSAHDAGQCQGIHYLVMALVDGADLAELVARLGPLPIADACEIARQAAIGLQHVVEQGLVHRDVKPCNLMLARDGHVKLLDLGLARSASDATANTVTMKGTLLGTADYLAPEQWDHPHSADARADIYSLGCTLYHLLAGRPPFADAASKTVLAKMQAHQLTPAPPVTRFRADVPPLLAAILDRMLAKNPAARFASPAEVAAALQPFTTGANLPALLRLYEASSPPGAWQARDTARPWQAALDTSTVRLAKKDPPRSGRQSRVLWLGAVVTAACLLWIAWHFREGWTFGPAAKPLEITDVRVTHWQGPNQLGELSTSFRPVRVEEGLQISARLSAPAYYYAIAFNPHGSDTGIEQLCYPLEKDGRKAPAVPPSQTAEILCPRGVDSFIPDAPGLQVFIIAASTKPLPSYAEWRKLSGKIPWTGPKEGGDWRGRFDGHDFTRFTRERGKIEPRERVPQAFLQICEFFKARPEFEAVQAIAIPVITDKK